MGKRELLARVCERSGFTRLMEWMPKRRGLMILNYHRIGNAHETPYDSGTFSATAEEFDWQIGYLKRHFPVITLPEALEMVNGEGGAARSASVLITFDDGYLDGYTEAFPILRAHGLPAVFFLPTAFVGTGNLPWWDVVAFLLKQSRRRVIHLQYPQAASFDLDAIGLQKATMQVLALYKQPSMKDPEKFVANVENACESSRPSQNAERCFLSWQEAREMQSAGMYFGSHTHSHPVLAQLLAEDQTRELRRSREILERELHGRVDTLAYPVGARHSFTGDTLQALRDTGYSAAFSFYGGFNEPGSIAPFDIRRWGVGDQSRARLRLQTALGTFTGRVWP
ncbi:MAG: polysaccharide deacetylase family protein [Acidobacteriaceae bacterium]|nr:polysaccharide deacetylase family protein [Acidobacteriaceae bacterium]